MLLLNCESRFVFGVKKALSTFLLPSRLLAALGLVWFSGLDRTRVVLSLGLYPPIAIMGSNHFLP